MKRASMVVVYNQMLICNSDAYNRCTESLQVLLDPFRAQLVWHPGEMARLALVDRLIHGRHGIE
jgi:hypothetical protein